jgi:hypothetical protein
LTSTDGVPVERVRIDQALTPSSASITLRFALSQINAKAAVHIGITLETANVARAAA